MRKRVLFVKTGAAGDVVRTTALLHLFGEWDVDWLAGKKSAALLPGNRLHAIYTEADDLRGNDYDLLLNLEDDLDLADSLSRSVYAKRLFGTIPACDGSAVYTEDSSPWFDMGLNSKFGIEKANLLKMENRRSYQEILYNCLGHEFRGEPYLLPDFSRRSTGLEGDIALAPNAGGRWPMKNWPFYEELGDVLSHRYKVNVLPIREDVLDHIADISGHKLLVTNDSLPMHIALGLKIDTVALFTCTSPWEIFDYKVLGKLISSKLLTYFYQKGYEKSVFDSIPVSLVEAQAEMIMAQVYHRSSH